MACKGEEGEEVGRRSVEVVAVIGLALEGVEAEEEEEQEEEEEAKRVRLSGTLEGAGEKRREEVRVARSTKRPVMSSQRGCCAGLCFFPDLSTNQWN